MQADRQALLNALGINADQLKQDTRAAILALCEEVLALRLEASDLRMALEAAEDLADHDTLCPVFNRRAFEREVRREIALAERFASPLSLIYIDLDRFKAVNDTFGHATGDAVLQRVATILRQSTRETDSIGRLGGDEFCVVLAHATQADAAAKALRLAERISSLIVRDEANPTLQAVRVGASCGVASWRAGDTVERLIARADQAMFSAKKRPHIPA